MTRAIEHTQHCTTMEDVRRYIDALDDVLVPLLVTLSRPGAPARVLDVNKALAEGRGDAERLKVAKQQVAKAVGMLGAEVTEVG